MVWEVGDGDTDGIARYNNALRGNDTDLAKLLSCKNPFVTKPEQMLSHDDSVVDVIPECNVPKYTIEQLRHTGMAVEVISIDDDDDEGKNYASASAMQNVKVLSTLAVAVE